MADEDWRPSTAREYAANDSRDVSRSVSSRARSEDFAATARVVAGDSRRRTRRATRSDLVLRFGGNLQHHTARDEPGIARPQNEKHRRDRRGNRRHGKSRLHRTDSVRGETIWGE